MSFEFDEPRGAREDVATLASHIRVRVLNCSAAGCLLETTAVVPVGAYGKLRVSFEGRDFDDTIQIVRCEHMKGTNSIYHVGIVFAPGGIPQHLYPHLDASLPHVNQEREYQAVNGACLLISRALFDECGGFNEAYVNGYEDIDLCLQARQRGRKVACCTSAFIYHYAQITEGRTVDDDRNAALFASRWGTRVRIDQAEYLARDAASGPPAVRAASAAVRSLADDCIYLADDLGQGSSFTWVNVELALALRDQGAEVAVNGSKLSPTIDADRRRRLSPLSVASSPVGGVQIKWSHYWPQHLNLELNGWLNLEVFVINYLFGSPGREPWDYWLQSLRQTLRHKLPDSEFCASVLDQIGIP